MATKIPASSSIPRFLLPRGASNLNLFRHHQQQHRAILQPSSLPLLTTPISQPVRYASNSSTPKPRTLAKPEKFNPPSHPARHVQSPNSKIRYFGPALTEAQKETHRTKQYPNMMPPEGTFMRWFLENRSIHVWIALVSYSYFLHSYK
jgi:hypothetical protein